MHNKGDRMKIFKHKDYDEYVQAQVDKNIRKKNNIWVTENEIKQIEYIIKKYILNNKSNKNVLGLCHGVRTGWEVHKLRKDLKIDVIGTEISPNASEIDNVIQWDFHNIVEDWRGLINFIYSNSFDHSYMPEKCLDVWMEQINENGIVMIHWMKTNENIIDAADCFAGSQDEYREMFLRKYNILEEVGDQNRLIFVINKNRS